LSCVPPCAPANATSPKQTTAAAHTPLLVEIPVEQLPNESVILFSIRVFCDPAGCEFFRAKAQKNQILGSTDRKSSKIALNHEYSTKAGTRPRANEPPMAMTTRQCGSGSPTATSTATKPPEFALLNPLRKRSATPLR
jgi:hypothetical protein